MSAATQMAPDSIPEDANASMGSIFGFHPETVENSQQADIAQLAYALWQQQGCPAGSAETDWFEAERQLNR
jgi:Protein of unknown function (DUF2934)